MTNNKFQMTNMLASSPRRRGSRIKVEHEIFRFSKKAHVTQSEKSKEPWNLYLPRIYGFNIRRRLKLD